MKQHAFLATPIDLAKTVEKSYGTDLPSVVRMASEWETTCFIIEFTRAAGSASNLDVEIQASFDGKTTWVAIEDLFQIPTNTPVVTGTTVRKLKTTYLPPGTPIRLGRVKNNDAGNDLTALQVSVATDL